MSDSHDEDSSLRERSERYRTLVEMSPAPIFVHVDGEVRYLNDAMARIVEADDRTDAIGTTVDQYLSDDQLDAVWEVVDAVQEGERADSAGCWTIETLGGDEKEVETVSRTVTYEGEDAVLTMLNDVTAERQFETAIGVLHERTTELLRADDQAEVAAVAVETAVELPGVTFAVHFDVGAGADRLVARTSAGDVASGPWRGEPSPITAGDHPAWGAFSDGEVRSQVTDAGAMIVYDGLGPHGVLAVGLEPDALSTGGVRDVVDVLTTNVAAALDRLASERELSERKTELERQRAEVARLSRTNELLLRVHRAIGAADSPGKLAETVCEAVGDVDGTAFAWLARHEGGETVEPVVWSGVDAEYLEQIRDDPENPLTRFAVVAARDHAVRTETEILADDAWRKTATASSVGFRSVAAVPIASGDDTLVLLIHREDPAGWDEREREALRRLAQALGVAMEHTRERVVGDASDRIALDVRVADERFVLNRFGDATGGHGTVDGLATASETDVAIVVTVSDDAPAGWDERLADSADVKRVTQLDDDGAVHRISLTGPALFRTVAELGGRVESVAVEDGGTVLSLELPGDASVRDFVDTVRDRYDGVELTARRPAPAERADLSRSDGQLDQLTDRQREALEVAYYGGYFEWPRDSTVEALAAGMDVASSTYQYHLRAAQRKLMTTILD